MPPLNVRQRLLMITDRLLTLVLAILLIGTTLAFGGAVWWAWLAIAALTFVFVLGCLLRSALEGRLRVLKSPLTFLGALALALATVQLAPLSPSMAARLSPRSAKRTPGASFPIAPWPPTRS